MKASGGTASPRGMGDGSTQKEISTTANSTWETVMALGNTLLTTGVPMKANGDITNQMASEQKYRQMTLFSKAISEMDLRPVLVK